MNTTPQPAPEDPFDAFPLAPFLASLGDDFELGLRDYQRISLALRSDGPWTLDQLRHVLVSLVVRQEAQEDVFLRRFDRFFDTVAPPPALAGDKEHLLADLRQRQAEWPKVAGETPPASPGPERPSRKRLLLVAGACRPSSFWGSSSGRDPVRWIRHI